MSWWVQGVVKCWAEEMWTNTCQCTFCVQEEKGKGGVPQPTRAGGKGPGVAYAGWSSQDSSSARDPGEGLVGISQPWYKR